MGDYGVDWSFLFTWFLTMGTVVFWLVVTIYVLQKLAKK